VAANTYYVDQALGSDSNTGLSQTAGASGPFATVIKGLSTLVSHATPGDTCYVKNGTYVGSPSFSSGLLQGTSLAPITLSAFPGHFPIIDGAGAATNGIELNANATTSSQKISWFVLNGFEVRNFEFTAIKFVNADHCTFTNNYCHDNMLGTAGGNGIYGEGINILIANNRLVDNGASVNPFSHGMYLSGDSYTIVNNLSVFNLGLGMQCRATGLRPHSPSAAYANFTNALIAHNTVAYNQNGSGMNQWIDSSQFPGGVIDNNRIVNNIFYENSHSAGTANGIRLFAGTNLLIQNNISFATAGALVFTFDTGSVNPVYQNNCPGSPNSNCPTLPAMVNAPANMPASPDFHLVAGSSAIGFGLNLSSLGIPSLATDIDGKVRPLIGAWDVGAYQFANVAPPILSPPRLPYVSVVGGF